MKKRLKETKNKKNQLENTSEPQDSEEEESFSKWLSSNEGVENLKLFVIGNSLFLFILISWPQIKEVIEAAYDFYSE